MLEQTYTLWPHQATTVEWMGAVETAPPNADVKGGVVGLAMGLGKTLIALHHCLTDKHKKPSLIVTKKPILDEWVKNGVNKFFKGKKVLVLDRKTSDAEASDEADIVITTYSYCTQAYKMSRLIMDMCWRRVVFDESHVMGRRTSLLFKASKTIASNSQFVWCMSGTPLCNKNTDLKIQLEVCGYPQKKKNWSLNIDNLANHTMFMDADCANTGNTPPVKKPKTVVHSIDMTQTQRALYTETIEKTVALTNGTDKKAHHKRLGYLGGMLTKLRQISIGAEMLGVKDQHANKARKVLEIAKTLNTKTSKLTTYNPTPDNTHHKMVVFTSFRKSVEIVRNMFAAEIPSFRSVVVDGSVKNKTAVIDSFQTDPSINCLFMNYKVGSEGLNITNASVVVLLEPWWNDAVHNQAIARALRPGQKKRVVIHQLITKDSIEEHMINLCSVKRSLRDRCFEDTPLSQEKMLTLDILKEQNDYAIQVHAQVEE